MSVRRRFAKIEKTVADLEERDLRANCICLEVQVATPGLPHKFEAEMNQICPVHGIRRMNKLIRVVFVAPEHYPEHEKEQIRKKATELDAVIEEYYERLAAAETSSSDD